MKQINTDVFKYCPIIDIPDLELYIYTNPVHGDSEIENMDISLVDAEEKVCQIVENSELYRKIIASRIRAYADDIERGEIKGCVSYYDGYPVPLHTKIEQVDWNQIKMKK